MDILKYLNSNDIREHLEHINYQFTSLEAAWIIWQSNLLSIDEKHKAWEEIIRTMPDCEITIDDSTQYKEIKLHSFLRKYMNAEQYLIKLLFEESNDATYSYRTRETSDLTGDFCWSSDFAVYSNIEFCFKEYHSKPHDNSLGICIEKQWTNDSKILCTLFSADGKERLRLEERGILTEDEKATFYLFQNLKIPIPLPFKKGDVVEVREPHHKVFVFDYVSNSKAHGFFTRRNGIIYKDCVPHALNLTYCKERLNDANRNLHAISSFFKENIEIDLLINACNQVHLETQLKSRQLYSNYTEEELAFAGLSVSAYI